MHVIFESTQKKVVAGGWNAATRLVADQARHQIFQFSLKLKELIKNGGLTKKKNNFIY
ncbi:hypothetical protein PGB90_008998 [Kerria lacca]